MLLDTIREDWIAARKAKGHQASVLGVLMGVIQTKQKNVDKDKVFSDLEILAEIKKLIESVSATMDLIKDDPTRADQFANLQIEKTALEKYIPAQMSDTELETFIVEQKQSGANLGGIMSALKANFGGKYDGKRASEIAKRVIAA